MKDFYDIYTLLNIHDFDGRVLQESTFSRRGTVPEQKHALFSGIFAEDQTRIVQWKAFINRKGLKNIPFEVVMGHIRTFLEPIYVAVLEEEEFFGIWCSTDKKWE